MVKIGKGYDGIPPIRVDRYIDQVIMTFFSVIACKADTECPGVFRNVPVLRIETVGVERFHAADRIRQLSADYGVFVAVVYDKTEEFKQFPVLFQKAPVQSGDLIVLAVAVVVAELGIAEFIACQKHGSPAAAHKYGTGIAYHAET